MTRAKVFILCGGRGRRLEPNHPGLPKVLVELRGKPILQHILEFYIQREWRQFVICAGYRSDLVRGFLSQFQSNAEIEISDSGIDAGMLERLYRARHLIGERAVITYGDTFIDIDIDQMLKEHLKGGRDLTLTVADIRTPFGIVKIDKDQKVKSFEEKPVFSYYIGHMILERRVLDELDERLIVTPDGEGIVKLFQLLARQKRLHAYKHKGLKLTFNTWDEHKSAEDVFVRFFTEAASPFPEEMDAQ